ncbi:MAG: halocarboxylic acid dehydrogenase DehI family protein [Candidatus Rokubacteria bacterium]|nr:halocarboxylic acid dehydrogenase DehI family protein [Candidatus Rokubacteria bacterium]
MTVRGDDLTDPMTLQRQIEEAQATGAAAALYYDLRATLRSSFVPTVYRILAAYPAYFETAWTRLRPNLATRDTERAADAIHRACVARIEALVPPDRGATVALAPAVRREIGGVLKTFVAVNPKNLLTVTALFEAWQGRPITGDPRAGDWQPISAGVPDGMPPIPVLPQGADDPRVREIFAEAAAVMGGAAVPSIYRTLARWPDYLAAAWRSLADPARGARLRAQAVPVLIAEATSLCHGLPFPFALDRATVAATLPARDVEAIEATLARFQRGITEAMLQIACLLRDLEGAAALGARPFGVPA